MSHALGQHHFHTLRLSKLVAINAVETLRSVADGLATIFVPLYFYSLNYSLTDIFLYFVVISLTWLISLYPVARLIARCGPRPLMAFSLVASIGQFLLLITLPSSVWPLWTIAVLSGLTTSCYWLGFRLMFARALAHHSLGKTVGVATALLILAGGLAPALGGAIATTWGATFVYTLAVVLYVCAILPLALAPSYHTINQNWPKLDFKKYWPDFLANGLFNADDAAGGSVWPLFIFLLLPSYAEVGIVSSVTLLTSIALSLYAGYHIHGKETKHNIRSGTKMAGLGNGLRVLAQNGLHVFGVNFVSGSGKALALTPYMTRYYTHLEQRGLPYVMGMQMAGAAAWLIYFSLMLVLSLLFEPATALTLGLLLAAPLVIGVSKMK